MSESDFGCVIIYLLPPNRNRLRLLQHTRRKQPRLQDPLLSHTVREHQQSCIHHPGVVRTILRADSLYLLKLCLRTAEYVHLLGHAHAWYQIHTAFSSPISTYPPEIAPHTSSSLPPPVPRKGCLHSQQREKFSTKGQCKVLILYASSRTNCK